MNANSDGKAGGAKRRSPTVRSNDAALTPTQRRQCVDDLLEAAGVPLDARQAVERARAMGANPDSPRLRKRG